MQGSQVPNLDNDVLRRSETPTDDFGRDEMPEVVIPEGAYASLVDDPADDANFHREHDHDPITMTTRVLNLIAILLPFAGLIVAMTMAWGYGFSMVHLSLLAGMYVATGLGITIGFHRYFAHKSFETNRVVQAILIVLGSMAVEGSMLRWVSVHRSHHQHSDKADDPHSPHQHGSGVINMFKGLWHAHVGWIFQSDGSIMQRYVADLRTDRMFRTLSALFPLWVVLGLVIPTVIGGLVTMSWSGAMLGLLWGGLVRIFFVHHVTWSINSACHIWGSQPFRSHDHSRNNPIFGVLAFGEGWHNNHHAFPPSAKHGLRWWEFDMSYIVIRTLSFFRLAWNVKVPSSDRIAARRH